MSRVQLKKIDKQYGEKAAVSGLDLDCENGEFVVLFGRPGAGKSTTLKMIAGIEDPSSGSIFFDGQVVSELPSEKRDVAMAFESYVLYPHWTVRQNLEFSLRAPGRQLSSEERDRRIKRVADLLEINTLLRRHPSQLSGGQRQRVSLGRALVRHAKAALLDEPISHLDARLRHDLRGELKLHQRENGVTTLYATPDFTEASAIADRIAVLIDGQLRQFAAPEEVYDRPADREVALMAGDPKINLFAVSFDPDGRADLICAQIVVPIPAVPAGVKYVGVRPSDISILDQAEAHAIPGTIYVAEPMGYDQLVRIEVGDQIVIVRLPLAGNDYQIGQPVWLRPDWSKRHLFDGAGKSLQREREGPYYVEPSPR
jgi:ABC-type sugar transport system ATPase subunit